MAEPTYEWNLVNAEKSTTKINGFDNVITDVHWECFALDADHPDVRGRRYGNVFVDLPEQGDPNFIPIDQVTRENLVDWVKEKLGDEEVAKIQQSAKDDLNRQINPPTTSFMPAN